MKKIFLILAMIIASYSTYAQSTFPTDGSSVGIATTNPEAGFKLDVNGLGAIGTQGSARIYMGTIDATHALIQSRDNSIGQNLSFYGSSYNFNGGNVGIGTTNPQNKFVISNGGAGGLEINPSLNYLGANGVWVTAYDRSALAYQDMVFDVSGAATTNVVIKATSGNVGIGTTDTHGYKLAVNGNAIATSMTVKLYADWPDYVFKKDYKLASLTEVKTYIDRNQHLPEMPSEQEIAKDGVNLGEMVKLQTKKIEELTLYLIDKDNKDKKKDAQLQLQQEQINQLKQQLAATTKALNKN